MVGTQLEESYEHWVTGVGLAYWALQKLRVQFLEGGADLAAGSLAMHFQTLQVVGI